MAYDLIPVLCMESFQIGGIALHICKIIENIRTLQRVVHTEFSHKSVVAVNVISAKQLRDVSLEKNLGIVTLQLIGRCIHAVQREVEVLRDEDSDIGPSAGAGADTLQDHAFIAFTTEDLADHPGIHFHLLSSESQAETKQMLVMFRADEGEKGSSSLQMPAQDFGGMLVVIHQNCSPGEI